MKKAKSIDELYAEIREKGCDLAITTDVSLATALNNRVDFPLLGSFAITPLNIASKVAYEVLGSEPLSDIELVRAISEKTGYDVRFVHGEITHIREIRRYTADSKKIIGELKHNRKSIKIYDCYSEMKTLDRVMEIFDDVQGGLVKKRFFSRYHKVAVIGLNETHDDDYKGNYTDLEKHMYPDDHVDIDRFHIDGDYSICDIFKVGNDRQLARNVVDLIDGDPNDYALVMNLESPIVDAVRSALYRKNIPFINALAFRDIVSVREYLEFIQLSLQYDILNVNDVKELYSRFGGSFDGNVGNYLLRKIPEDQMHGRSSHLRRLMSSINEKTFITVLNDLFENSDTVTLEKALNNLGFASESVTSSSFADLRYLMDNLEDLTYIEERPIEEKEGVLVVDCRKAGVIDRPIVFYLGMGQDWNLDLSGRRYIDSDDESKKERARMEQMLQQGIVRGYFVNITKKGRKVRPCTIFNEIYGRNIEDFDDMVPTKATIGRWVSDIEAVKTIKRDNTFPMSSYSGELIFSKTNLNKYHECPRKYFFNKIIGIDNKDVMEFGSLIHCFAEAYAMYPDEIDGMDEKDIIRLINDRYSGLSSPVRYELDSDKIRIQLDMIKRFIKENGIKASESRDSTKNDENFILDYMKKTKRSDICEVRIESDKIHLRGVVDLIFNRHFYDYKSGKLSDPNNIVRGMDIDSDSIRYSEFQPLSYLSISNEKGNDADEFILFYPYGNDVMNLNDDIDLDRNMIHILIKEGNVDSLILEEMRDIFTTNDIIIDVLSFKEKIVKKVGESKWAKLDKSMVPAQYSHRKDVFDYVFSITKKAILSKIIVRENRIIIPSQYVGRFVSMVGAYSEQGSHYMNDDFPARPRIRCSGCEFRSLCTYEVIEDQEDDFNE